MLIPRFALLLLSLVTAHVTSVLATTIEVPKMFKFPICLEPTPKRADALDVLHASFLHGISVIVAQNGTSIRIPEIRETANLVVANIKRSTNLIDTGRPIIKSAKCQTAIDYLTVEIDDDLEKYTLALEMVTDRAAVFARAAVAAIDHINIHLNKLVEILGDKCPSTTAAWTPPIPEPEGVR